MCTWWMRSHSNRFFPSTILQIQKKMIKQIWPNFRYFFGLPYIFKDTELTNLKGWFLFLSYHLNCRDNFASQNKANYSFRTIFRTLNQTIKNCIKILRSIVALFCIFYLIFSPVIQRGAKRNNKIEIKILCINIFSYLSLSFLLTTTFTIPFIYYLFFILIFILVCINRWVAPVKFTL